MRVHQQLRSMCRRANVDPDSTSGLMFVQALNLRQITNLSARVHKLENQQQQQQQQQLHTSRSEVIRLSREPLLETREELARLDDLDQRTRAWISSVGGNSAKDHVTRVLNGLLSTSLQCEINRTGGFGKMRFPAFLETIVSDSCRSLFPSETITSVEKLIIRFFKNASDRAGGRKQRSAIASKQSFAASF